MRLGRVLWVLGLLTAGAAQAATGAPRLWLGAARHAGCAQRLVGPVAADLAGGRQHRINILAA